VHSVRIVGVGSPFGDDCVGWQAACYLEQQINQRYPGSLQRCDLLDRPGAVLLDYLKPGDGIILLLDAVVAQPGMAKVASYTLEDLAGEQAVSSHGFGVAETLTLGRTLGLLHSEIYLLGIASGSNAWQEPLIAEVEAILG
jgi:hydrogenase maturation protease